MPISFQDWVSETRENVSETPKRGIMQALYTVYLGAWFTATSRWEIGTNIYDREWDVLLVLDACRVDAMEEVADEYDFIGNVESMWSVASGSYEWLVKTFQKEYLDEIEGTVHITSNGFVEKAFYDHEYAPSVALPFGWPKGEVVTADNFAFIDRSWKEGGGPPLHTVPPEHITDLGIEYGRSGQEYERMILHYMQPHIPWITEARAEDRGVTEIERKPFRAFRNGEISKERAWQLYVDNLRLVLDDIEEFLENIDAETVAITADHGNAFGELGVTKHPTGFPHPVIKKVPWVETTATDEGTREPQAAFEAEMDDSQQIEVEAHLRDLGYMS